MKRCLLSALCAVLHCPGLNLLYVSCLAVLDLVADFSALRFLPPECVSRGNIENKPLFLQFYLFNLLCYPLYP